MKTLLAFAWLLTQATAPPPAVTHDYVVGVQDVLQIVVHGQEELSREAAVVDRDGTIECPSLGRVPVAGKTPREIEEDLKARYLKKQILTRASVTVTVKDFRSQTIHLTGEGIRNPGTYPMTGNESLVTAIGKAGGFTAQAGAYIIVVRKPKGDTNLQTATRVDEAAAEDQLKILKADLDLARAPTVFLRDGDTIHIPKAEQYYVTGEVKSAAGYVWTPELTVLKAITTAGGKTDRAGGVEILRTVDGKPAKVNAKDNTVVLPGDIIKVKRRLF